MFNRPVLFLGTILIGLTSCTSGSSVDSGDSDLSLSQTDIATTTGASGNAEVSFTIPPGSSALELVAFSGTGRPVPVSLRQSSGSELLTVSTQGTYQATQSVASPSTLNFPYLSATLVDAPYQAQFQLSTASPGQDVRVIALSKRDSDLRNGTLKVNFISVGPAADSEDIREDLQGVVERVKSIYSGAGLSLDPESYQFAGETEIPDPRPGSSLYETISTAVRPFAVNVVLGGRVADLSGDNRYGVAGASPGPALPSVHSAVVIDIIQVTGGDGTFEIDDDNSDDQPGRHDDEIRFAAEEISRGIARYLGLEDIVEFRGSQVVRSDSLSDTESCITELQCREQGLARFNVMMPRALRKSSEDSRRDRDRDEANDYYAREEFTDQQRLVLNRHILVD